MEDGDDFAFIDLHCPRCGTEMRPTPLASGAVVLRCQECGLVVI